jgi:hypothetical protein
MQEMQRRKMTKKRAIEIAIAALDLEVSCGNLQSNVFDDALMCLREHYDMDDLIQKLGFRDMEA